jgi:chromosome segregation ATPase
MALANIFTKLSELEKKIQSLDRASLSSDDTSGPSGPDVSELLNRLVALETSQVQYLERVAALESVQSQVQQQVNSCSPRVDALEFAQSQIQQQVNNYSPRVDALETSLPALNNKIAQLESVFLDKLNYIESVVIADLSVRVLVLEDKTSEL